MKAKLRLYSNGWVLVSFNGQEVLPVPCSEFADYYTALRAAIREYPSCRIEYFRADGTLSFGSA